MNHQMVVVLDFGGQYNQLIARRVRECNVYCEVKPYTTPLSELKAMNPIGFIFTGGPGSVYAAGAPMCDPAIFELGVPVMGICYRPDPGRKGHRGPGGQRPGVWQDKDLLRYVLQAVQGLARRGHLLDEPWGLYGQGARGL